MTHDDAVEFLAAAGPWRGSWADIGAGTGTFTRALAELIGPQGTVLAIDRETSSIAELARIAGRIDRTAARVSALRGDMHDLSAIVELQPAHLDGVLFANVLHFTSEPEAVLAQTAERLRSDGRIVVVEYDRRTPNPWVPHPLPFDRLADVAGRAGLGAPREVARQPSAFHSEMYCAALAR
jgi:SAM-dependent methyltransferase